MADNIHNNSASMDYFLEEHYRLRTDFNLLMTLPSTDPVFIDKMEEYVKWVEDNYDPTMFIDDSRPYAPTAGRYVIYTEEALSHDPFGYYQPRHVSQQKPNPHMPYFMEFPQTDSQWLYNEQFNKDD